MKYEFDVSWLIFCLVFPVYVFFIEGWNFLPGLMSAALLSMLLAASHHQLAAQLLMRREQRLNLLQSNGLFNNRETVGFS